MAFTGHIISHSPQRIHLSLSTITSSFSSFRAFVGHFLTQTPHAMHASTSVTILPVLGPLNSFLTKNILPSLIVKYSSPSVIASNWHVSTHFPQYTHLSSICTGDGIS